MYLIIFFQNQSINHVVSRLREKESYIYISREFEIDKNSTKNVIDKYCLVPSRTSCYSQTFTKVNLIPIS